VKSGVLKAYLKGKGRLALILIIQLVVILVITARYSYLMLIAGPRERAEPVTLPDVERGPILDRSGKILAITTVLDSVSAWIPNVDDPEASARILAEVLDMDRREVLSKLSTRSGFVWIKRKITPSESERIRRFMSEGELRGVDLEPEFGRNYPERSFACHLIGYVGIDNTGLDGIEWSFQRELLPTVMGGDAKEVYGNQVYLTIDINVQYFTEKLAREALEQNRADSVMIMVMDAPSGDMLAYASLPGFDPNNFARYEAEALINRPIRTAYEPGSVFKIFSISSFLQLGGITPRDTFYAGGVYEQPEYGIRINDLAAYGRITTSEILKYSSNVGAAYASETVGADEFYDVLRRFGFGGPTGVPLSGETSGILKEPSQWSSRTKPTIAFGQEISVSAMQMMSAATALTNDGVRLQPRIVEKIVSPEGRLIKEYKREPVADVLSPRIAQTVLEMMETATGPGGTAHRAAIDGIRVSGKTGTAQVPDPETGTYYEDRHIASFLGIVPTDDPELIIYVVIDNPKGEHYYGSRIAAPVFRELATVLLPLRGIPTEDSRVVHHSGKVVVDRPEQVSIGAVVPDLIGTPKRALLSLFERDDLEIVFIGEGYVVRQRPSPGTPVRDGLRLVLEFD